MANKIEQEALDFVLGRLSDPRAIHELQSLGPPSFDWMNRVKETCEVYVPKFVGLAGDLVKQCEATVNSASDLRNELSDGCPVDSSSAAAKQWLVKCRNLAESARQFVDHVESQQISAEIQRIAADKLSRAVYANGNSTYPDFVRRDLDYSFLPFQSRTAPIDGPCLKRANGTASARPSNVPDGIELKTNRGPRIKVDAHGAHPGLHLGVTWEVSNARLTILGIFVSYIRIFDHTISGGRVAVTTKKASFGHEHFFPIYVA